MNNEEYLAQLLTKLTVLIGTLKVAVVKIEAGMQAPGADVERMTKVRDNLINTLAICERAHKTLMNKASREQPIAKEVPSGVREYTEMTSLDEYRKFQMLPPITSDDVMDVDWQDLLGKL
jgi:hypothetical protein